MATAMARAWTAVYLFFRRIYIFQLAARIYVSYKYADWRGKALFARPSKEKFDAGDAERQTEFESQIAAIKEKEDEFWEAVHERNALMLYKAIVSLQGLWIKAGQYLSTRGDVLPAPWVKYFMRLQDSVPERPIDVTKATICAELGIPSIDIIYENFQEKPIATASIAQVHRATIRTDFGATGSAVNIDAHPMIPEAARDSAVQRLQRDLAPYAGMSVVIKVQHHNVREKVLQDLVDLDFLIRLIAWAEPDWDFRVIVNEWATEVPKELDFTIETESTETIRDATFQHSRSFHKRDQKDESLEITCAFADPVGPLVTKKVLTMKYIDGFKILDKDAYARESIDVDFIVNNIVKAYAFQLFTIGFWNSDPHPGNFLVARDTDPTDTSRTIYMPVLLDFGLTRRATPSEAMALCKMILAAESLDYATLLSGLQEMGLSISGPEGTSLSDYPEEAMEIVQRIFRPSSNMEDARKEADDLRKEREANAAKRKEDQAKQKKAAAKEKETKKKQGTQNAFPGVLIFFGRVIQLLRGVCLSLGSNVSYIELMVPFAKHYLKTVQGETSKYGKLLHDSTGATKEGEDEQVAKVRDDLHDMVKSMIDNGDILGLQVSVIRSGKPLLDFTAGMLGTYDPRPVESNTIFPVFSAGKPVAASALHWLINDIRTRFPKDRHIHYDDAVIKYWPEYAARVKGQAKAWKEKTTITHVLAHKAGLQNAANAEYARDAFSIVDWEAMRKLMEDFEPAGDPDGDENTVPKAWGYHTLSFGWLVGCLAEKIALQYGYITVPETPKTPSPFPNVRKQPFNGFVQLVTERVLKPLGISDEMFFGVPVGEESRLASVTWDVSELKAILMKFREMPAMARFAPQGGANAKGVMTQFKGTQSADESSSTAAPSVEEGPEVPLNLFDADGDGGSLPVSPGLNPLAANPTFFNHLRVRRAVIPAGNGNGSARALAQFYQSAIQLDSPFITSSTLDGILTDNGWGWEGGFKRFTIVPADGSGEKRIGIGHGGLGGSLALADPKSQTSIAIVVNNLSIVDPKTGQSGVTTAKVLGLVAGRLCGFSVAEWDVEGRDGGSFGRTETTMAIL
ncbi:beta-lactamase/transpeptidase-like protein [Cladochytrium replicatum]|nr:beta-lactamase/transpeptidase-like protein [Cladochytrium replicatum]